MLHGIVALVSGLNIVAYYAGSTAKDKAMSIFIGPLKYSHH